MPTTVTIADTTYEFNIDPLPVNIMTLPDTPSSKQLAALGVARISYGGMPYDLAERSMRLFADKVLPELKSWSAPALQMPATAVS